jgi:hypothetical protein
MPGGSGGRPPRRSVPRPLVHALPLTMRVHTVEHTQNPNLWDDVPHAPQEQVLLLSICT